MMMIRVLFIRARKNAHFGSIFPSLFKNNLEVAADEEVRKESSLPKMLLVLIITLNLNRISHHHYRHRRTMKQRLPSRKAVADSPHG